MRYMKQIEKDTQKISRAEGGSALNLLPRPRGTQVFPDTSGVGLPTGVFDPQCCCSATCAILDAAVKLSSGPSCHGWALRVAVWPFTLPSGPLCRRQALRSG